MTLDSAPAMRRHPTILDVASHAGVSKSTVSNVVRGLPGVSEATRRRVRSSILELGYRPNVLARQLVQRRTSILGVVVGDLANPFFAEMAKSVERHAAARGYTAMFCNTEGDSQSELAGIETLLEHRVAGIVFLAFSGDSRTMQATLQHQVPAVFVSCRAEWGDVVSVDDAFGGRLGTRHLIDCGHRRISFLSVPDIEDASDRARWDGYSDALREAGLGPPVKISWSPPADHARVDGVERTLLEVFEEAPAFELPADSLYRPLVDVLVETKIESSKGSARQNIQGGGIYLNNVRVTDVKEKLSLSWLLHGRYLVVRRGKRNYYLIRFV